MRGLFAFVCLVSAHLTNALSIDVNDADSIKSTASSLALGLMKWYTGNVTDTAETIGVLPSPYYWWESGAMWGGMLDYYHYTGDASYNPTVTQALMSQVGPNYDFMMPIHYNSEGNDDQAFWGFAAMDAAEMDYPAPTSPTPSWLQLTINLWNTQVARWDTSSCNGGLKWQIFTTLNGYDYKNSVSNGAFFQLSARLARYTGNTTYLDWATKVYDWTANVGFINPTTYAIYDGASDLTNCTPITQIVWSYNLGIHIYGASIMYNLSTSTSEAEMWGSRVNGMLSAIQYYFFSPYSNATNIMYESACETIDTCNNDQLSFKAYLSRFLWKATKMMPSLTSQIQSMMQTTASAAVESCEGSGTDLICGSKWYVGGYDGVTGPGQMLSALETVQGLLSGAASAPVQDESVASSSSSGTTSVAGVVVVPTATSTATTVVATSTAPDTTTTALVEPSSSMGSSSVATSVSASPSSSTAVSSTLTRSTATSVSTNAAAQSTNSTLSTQSSSPATTSSTTAATAASTASSISTTPSISHNNNAARPTVMPAIMLGAAAMAALL